MVYPQDRECSSFLAAGQCTLFMQGMSGNNILMKPNEVFWVSDGRSPTTGPMAIFVPIFAPKIVDGGCSSIFVSEE